MIGWAIDNGLSTVIALGAIAAAIYLARARISDRMSVAWREVAEANRARIEQLEGVVAEQSQQIDVLTAQVELLGSRPDLTAAIHELTLHEIAAQDRHSALLAEIRTLIKGIGINDGLGHTPLPG